MMVLLWAPHCSVQGPGVAPSVNWTGSSDSHSTLDSDHIECTTGRAAVLMEAHSADMDHHL